MTSDTPLLIRGIPRPIERRRVLIYYYKESYVWYCIQFAPQLKKILLDLKTEKGNPHQTELVFKTSQQSTDKSIKLYSKKAGIQKTVCFHSLRTSFITWGLERGDSMGELLNATLHSSARMLRYYDRTDTLKKNSIFKIQV